MNKDQVKHCDVCRKKWPSAEYRIAEFAQSIAYLHHDQFFPGWCVLILKHHATELFHLSPEVNAQLLQEVTLLAKVLQQTFNAVKINYALFGNLVPHIHWHIIPRLENDPAIRHAVFAVDHEPKILTAQEREQRIHLILQSLKLPEIHCFP